MKLVSSQQPVSPLQALGLLFDPSVSAVQLVDINVTGPRTIEAQWRMGGYLRFPCERLTTVVFVGSCNSWELCRDGSFREGQSCCCSHGWTGGWEAACASSVSALQTWNASAAWSGCGGQHHSTAGPPGTCADVPAPPCSS